MSNWRLNLGGVSVDAVYCCATGDCESCLRRLAWKQSFGSDALYNLWLSFEGIADMYRLFEEGFTRSDFVDDSAQPSAASAGA